MDFYISEYNLLLLEKEDDKKNKDNDNYNPNIVVYDESK